MSTVKRLRVPLLSCMFTAAMAALLPVTGAQAAAWSVVPSPNPAASDELAGVASISASDVWAAGGSSSGTLTMHWNGTAWQAVKSPNPAKGTNTLAAVGANSSTDVWAVGASGAQTLTEHWNGKAWKAVPSPSPGTLSGVAAVSATDVWAVGNVGTFGATGNSAAQTLIEHWNGTSWSVVPSPSPGTAGSQLNAVTAVSATDVWAVGKTAATGSTPKTLIEHWDGHAWAVVPSPDASTGFNVLTGVAAISASDLWAVGEFVGTTGQALIEHWDGTSWTVVPSANPSTGDDGLSGVAAVSATDIWAVGTGALIEHWDGTSWAVVPSPSTGGDTLNAVAADPGTGQAWAVGSTSFTGTGGASTFGHHTLTEVYR